MAVDGAGGAVDLLGSAEWSCAAAAPGSAPDDVGGTQPTWLPATVPGTVAGALRAVGTVDPPLEQMDGQDWWFRCRFAGPPAAAAPAGGGWLLELEGLATLTDVWLNGRHLLHSESMFRSWRVPVDAVGEDNELLLRFAALTPALEERRPRPRWKVKGVSSQNLRWFRTTLLGRLSGWAVVPAPVGPWRPVRLRRADPLEVTSRRVRASCPSGPEPVTTGTVTVELIVSGDALSGTGTAPAAEIVVADRAEPLTVVADGSAWRLSGSIAVDGVERWWPHTHGTQTRYRVRAVVDGVDLDLGEVGFRTVTADLTDGGFRLEVNGVPVFCRGACWYPIDPVSLQATDEEMEATVGLARDAGCNMLRITGGTLYEDERFFAACDRAGILVWQDAIFCALDPPDDAGFLEVVATEVSALLDRTASHPSLAVLCGGEEVEQQPAMLGLPRDRWRSTVLDVTLPDVVDRDAPGLVYVSSSPGGGDLPFQADAGTCHYFGVGWYRRPLDDFRRSAPRFVTQCLGFAVPPERSTVDSEFGAGLSTRLEPNWRRAIHRDAGAWFDIEDARDWYAGTLFHADIGDLWGSDPDRALDLGRAAVVEAYAAAIAEWRRPGSPCQGMLAIALRDLRPGPGWGFVDSSGRPKAPWFALARGSAPVAVLATDEGLNGLDLHLVNDTADEVAGSLVIGLHSAAHEVERASCPVTIPARGGITVRAESLFDGFRDITYAYRFGPRSFELVTAELLDAGGRVLADTGFLPGGPARGHDPDVGLQAEVGPVDGGVWPVRVSSRRFAQYVQVDVPGFVPDDSWFHLPPGGSRSVRLRPEADHGSGREPKGRVRALNSAADAPVSS